MSALDDDEELFNDIYGDDEETKDTKTDELKDNSPEIGAPKSEDTSTQAPLETTSATADVEAAKPEPTLPPGQVPVTAAVDAHGLTSHEIGKQLQEKSEYFNRDQGKMFIGGLNWDTTEEKLKDYFGKYGEIIDFTIMRDSATGRPRGFAFLTFRFSSSVDEVLKTTHVLDGKVIDPKRAIPKEEQDKTGKIFVGGIAPEVTEQDFDEFFSRFGNVIDAQLMIDKDSGRSRGFGFVTYDSPDSVDRVTENKYLKLKGRQMEIKRAEPRGQQQQRTGGMRGYNANTAMQLQQQQHQGYGGYQQAAYGQNQMAAGYNPQVLQQYWQYWMQMQQSGQQMTPQQIQQMQVAMQQQGVDASGQGAQPEAFEDDGGEKPLKLQSSAENESSSDNNNSGGRRQLNLPKGPKGGRGGYNRGRGGYGRNGGYHPYNR